MPPPAEPPEHEGAHSEGQDAATRASLALVNELSEALTALTNYLEAASRLDAPNTQSARRRQSEALEKGLAQLSRADGLLRRLRSLLRDQKRAADR
jgi:hypothetical protein